MCTPVHLVGHLYYRVFVLCDFLTAVDMTKATLTGVNAPDNVSAY